MKNMKWWGWGEPNVAFNFSNKPKFAPFVKKHLTIDLDKCKPVSLEFDQVFGEGDGKVRLQKSRMGIEALAPIQQIVGENYVRTDDEERVIHTYGKSLRDLVRLRKGNVGRLPDAVVFPGNEEEVLALLQFALTKDMVVIPFGGGSNITGSLETPLDEDRFVLSVDLQRMNKVLEIDEVGQQARIQSGALGPELEDQLNRAGWSIGHFPDSFNHSSLGGWIATRSSGMQSDKYGDIAQITRAVRVATPNGLLSTRSVPSTSAGPSVREMILGSEGRLGIITEATVQVHRIAESRKILGYLFPSFEDGISAMREIATGDASVFVARLSDAAETAFTFATQKDSGIKGKLLAKGLEAFLTYKNIDPDNMCLSFLGFEGSSEHVARQRRLVGRIVSSHGGVCVGSSPGQLYDQKKFDTPYIRDFLLDRGVLADVSETAAPWSSIIDVHDGVVKKMKDAFISLGIPGYVMCHMSHTQHTGACLYFTFALVPDESKDTIEQYDTVKRAAQQTFIDLGATLSHHHSVGVEHATWLEPDISAPGVAMLRALIGTIDKGNNLNPDKVIRTR